MSTSMPLQALSFRSPAPRTRSLAAFLSCVLLVGVTSACTREEVIGVDLQDVGIQPSAVTVFENDSVQLSAIVRDADGMVLDGAPVQWTSDAPEVVSVSPSGLVSGLGAGPAVVSASVGKVRGSAQITVLATTSLQADPGVVQIRGAAGMASPAPTDIVVRDASGGTVDGLSASLTYPPGGASGWAAVSIRSTPGSATTATATLTSSTTSLTAGTYAATLVVTAPSSRPGPVHVPVSLTLAGVTIEESDGSTRIGPTNPTDSIRVSLELAPSSAVTIVVGSSNRNVATASPARIVFTPADWSTPQVVTVGASEDADLPVDGTTQLTFDVDASASDPAYAPVPRHSVDVVSTSGGGGPNGLLSVSHTLGSTEAREGGGPDLLVVSLRRQPQGRVVIAVEVDDKKDAEVEPKKLTFTVLDWALPRVVSFRAVDDDKPDGDQIRVVTFSFDRASAEQYRSNPPVLITATTRDNDPAKGGS